MANRNFIVGYDIDENNNKIIHSYGENIEGSFRDSLVNSGKYLESDFCEYKVNDNLDYYINGKKMTDYEIFLKFGIEPSEDMTYNYNGVLVNKTDNQKMVEGIIPLQEGFEINNGQVVPIPYYFLKEAYKKGMDAFYNEIKAKIEEYRADNEKNILVNMEGVRYSFNQESLDTLAKLINLGIDIEWRDNDNKIQKLTKEQALKLIKTVEEKKQSILKKIWEAKDTIKSMIQSNKTFEEIIDYAESFISRSLDNRVFQQTDTFWEQMQGIDIPEETPYSGLIAEEEIQNMKSQKKLKKNKSVSQ